MSASGSVGGLCERERELARAVCEFDSLESGVGSSVVVEGPPGIGKTELLGAIGDHARVRGLGVVSARGSEFEQEIAFGVARQLFEPSLRMASARERRRLLDAVARVGARALGVVAGDPPPDRFAAIHGLFWLCANRAEREALVVVIDDVQWVDDPSLAWLAYLARRVGDLHVLLVLGLRSGDPGGERAELTSLADSARQRIALEPLSARAVGMIVRAQLGEDADESFCAACSELTGGNPLFVRELLAAAREQRLAASGESIDALRRIAPSAVGTSILARLGRLGPEAVALARALAILGDGAEVALAARLAGLDVIAGELTSDRLAAAQIFALGRPLEFFHPLIGTAIRDDIAPGARRVAHRRAAELVGARGEGSLARVAAHLLACGPAGDRWVVETLRDAARQALERGAPDVAADYLRRALSEPPGHVDQTPVLFLLGTAEWRVGEPEAIAHLEQAIATATDDDRTLIAACTLLALAYNVTDRAERAVEVLDLALSAAQHRSETLTMTERLGTIEPEPLRDPRVALMLEAAMAIVGMLDVRTAPAALRRAEALRGRLRTLADPPVYLLVMLAYSAARSNRASEARDLAERALRCHPYPPPLEISTLLIHTLALIECYDTVQRLCDELLAVTRRRSAQQETVAILVTRATASCDVGALADAEADARWALERADGRRRIHALSELLRVLVERDALDEAEDLLGHVPDPAASHSADAAWFLMARGRLRRAQGRLHEALDDSLRCGERCDRLGMLMLSGVPWRAEAALIHAALANVGEARRLAGEQLELARLFGRPRTLGISLRACGLVEGGTDGLELLAEAVRTLETSESPLELARALADYGGALRRAARRIEARSELERALDLAHRLGARRIANQARVELTAVGAKPRRDAITGRDALTAGELRVARLAAEGLTNREVAQALFITTNTAKAHLSRVYRKLDITRRDQLGQALTVTLPEMSDDPRAVARIS